MNTSRFTVPTARPWAGRLALILGMLLALLAMPRLAVAASPAPVVLGTDFEDATFSGRWLRLIYTEAFRRLDHPLEFAVFPTRRLSAEVDQGHIDGEAVRVYAYANAHPNLVRVEESVLDVEFVLYTANLAVRLERLEELPASGLLGEYRRGVALCENTLKQWVPAARLSDVATTEQGLKKILALRTDFYCDLDNAMLTALVALEFKGVGKVRKLLKLGNPLSLYPYLHKKNAALAPRLAAALKQMKAEGLIERYRIDTEREFGVVR